MIVLGLDTATLTAGIGVVAADGTELAAARHDASGRTADLLVSIDAACTRAGVTPKGLGAVAVGAGPGSFTGLRIGMATAKGIAFAAGIPLWSVSSLAALAADVRALAASPGGVIAAVLDARRGEVFAGVFDAAGAPLAEERVCPPDVAAAWIIDVASDRPLVAGGDAIDAFGPALAPLADRWSAVRTPSGLSVARLALAGSRDNVLLHGAPTYIRPSEAEVMYPDGVPGALRKR